MRRFHWIAPGAIPRSQDLRLCGWERVPVAEGGALGSHLRAFPALIVVSARQMGAHDWELVFSPDYPDARRFVIILDVMFASERVQLLQAGVGDAFAPDVFLGELSARAERALESAQRLPRLREHGGLKLDLFARDAFAAGRPLGLHPREFALLWRLTESPGQAIGKAELIAEVWRRNHIPETNSLAVHVSRLRAKLATAGFGGLIETAESGSYLIREAA